MNPTRHHERGAALVDALFAMVLLTFSSVSTASLVHGAIEQARRAERIDRAREAAEAILLRLSGESWHALPGYFGADPADATATLSTVTGSAPAGWSGLVDDLPNGRADAVLEGLGPGGVLAPYESAVALRVRVNVSYRQGLASRRSVRLTTVRF